MIELILAAHTNWPEGSQKVSASRTYKERTAGPIFCT
jgi:hypothetical protein